MCLIVFAWQPESPTVLRLAANRDEFYSRPSAALSEWPDAPGVFAGRDLQAGGTWLGVTAQGRFAALTNIRDPRQKAGPRSRGALTADYLLGQESAPAYLDRIMRDATEYAGFNLLVGDAQQLWHFNSQEGQPRQLESGIYGLSNASLDTPWPKLLRARDALSERIDGVDEDLLEMLSDSSQPASRPPAAGHWRRTGHGAPAVERVHRQRHLRHSRQHGAEPQTEWRLEHHRAQLRPT